MNETNIGEKDNSRDAGITVEERVFREIEQGKLEAFHYTPSANQTAMLSEMVIHPSRDGYVYLTPTSYGDPTSAAQELAMRTPIECGIRVFPDTLIALLEQGAIDVRRVEPIYHSDGTLYREGGGIEIRFHGALQLLVAPGLFDVPPGP